MCMCVSKCKDGSALLCPRVLFCGSLSHSKAQRRATQRNTAQHNGQGRERISFLIHFVALCSCLLQLLLASTCSKDTRTAEEREEIRREESAHSAPFLLLL